MSSRALDQPFIHDLKEARLQRSHPLPHLTLGVILALTAAALIWASLAVVDEVTHGFGQVVPSGRVQQIQNLEGGILSEMAVQEGQVVQKGEVLLRIDDTSAAANFRDYLSRKAALEVGITRLTAELAGQRPVFSPTERQQYAEMVRAEEDLYEQRVRTLESNLESLRQSLETARKEYLGMQTTVARLAAEAEGRSPAFSQELREQYPLLVEAEMALFRARQRTVRESLSTLHHSRDLARQELELNQPLVKKGIVSEIEVLRLQRQVSELEGKITDLNNSFREQAAQELSTKKAELLRLQRQAGELEGKISDRENLFRTQAREEMQAKQAELDRLNEVIVSMQDRFKRTTVLSPVFGTVKKIHINTIGGVIKPGMDIMEVVPLDDTLVVEAKVRPADIAFISPGQKAKVKVTAYDFSIYGGLEGEVEHISADTIVEGPQEPYYLVRVRTQRNYIEKDGKRLAIKPGMTTAVDILTGQKTVLEYLVKPFVKARYSALRER